MKMTRSLLTSIQSTLYIFFFLYFAPFSIAFSTQHSICFIYIYIFFIFYCVYSLLECTMVIIRNGRGEMKRTTEAEMDELREGGCRTERDRPGRHIQVNHTTEAHSKQRSHTETEHKIRRNLFFATHLTNFLSTCNSDYETLKGTPERRETRVGLLSKLSPLPVMTQKEQQPRAI